MKYSLCHDFLNSKKIIYPLAKYASSYLAGERAFAPWSVEIHPTAKCNHRCIHCSYKERNESRVEMPHEVFDQLVASMIEMHVHGVYFSGGGEPCAYPGLAGAVKKLHENGVEVALVSNGTLFEQMGMMDVADHLNYIALSVPSCTPAMFEKITGRPYLDRVLALPGKIKERYGDRAPIVGSRVVVTNLIAKEVPSILETLKTKAFDYVIFKVVRDYEDRGLGLSDDMVAELKEEIRKIGGVQDKSTTTLQMWTRSSTTANRTIRAAIASSTRWDFLPRSRPRATCIRISARSGMRRFASAM